VTVACFASQLRRPDSSSYVIIKVLVKPNVYSYADQILPGVHYCQSV